MKHFLWGLWVILVLGGCAKHPQEKPDLKQAVWPPPVSEVQRKHIDALIKKLNTNSMDNVGRDASIAELRKIGLPAVPQLFAASFKNRDYDVGPVLTALKFDESTNGAVPDLIKKAESPDPQEAETAGLLLGCFGIHARTAVPALGAIIKKREDLHGRVVNGELVGGQKGELIGGVVENVAKALADPEQSGKLSLLELKQSLRNLESVKVILQQSQLRYSPGEGQGIGVLIAPTLKTPLLQIQKQILLREKEEQEKALPFPKPLLGFALFAGVIVALFAFFPISLLHFNDIILQPAADVLPKPFNGPALVISRLCVLHLQYHPRVLDAWVKKRLPKARERFDKRKTVMERSHFVPVPVTFDGESYENMGVADLQLTFAGNVACLLIWGEGGGGKTSLACRIGRWALVGKYGGLAHYPMLPVLVEDAFTCEEGLVETVRGILQNLCDEERPIPTELVEQLLRKKRVVVIVDHLSEMPEATRNLVRPAEAKWMINALVVTSRQKEELGQVHKTEICPLRFGGSNLTRFLEKYLPLGAPRFGLEPTLELGELHAASGHIVALTGGRAVTPLMARLFADWWLASKTTQIPNEVPKNVPELMLSYLKTLNATIEVLQRHNWDAVRHDAQILAWECLKETLKPQEADYLMALKILGGLDAVARFDYLENRLQLVRRVGISEERFKFELDPLAEYIAAYHLVGRFQKRNWRYCRLWLTRLEAKYPDPILFAVS